MSLLIVCAFTLLLLICVSRAIFFVAVISGNSMEPTLREGDLVIALKHFPARLLRRGQVVVIRLNNSISRRGKQPPDLYIKRVLALPNETVIKHLSELSYYYRANLRCLHDDKGQRTWVVPQGHFFVQGDHLPRGYDSLTWGPIPRSAVVGIAVAKLFTGDGIFPQLMRRTDRFD